MIKKEAALFGTKQQLDAALLQIQKLAETHEFGEDFNELYDISVEDFKDFPAYIPNTKTVGTWIFQNGSEYFATPTRTTESYQDEVEEARTAIQVAMDVPAKKKTVTRQRKVITGYASSEETPYKGLELDFLPKYENISRYSLFMLFIYSKRHLRAFTQLCPISQTGWETYTVNSTDKWTTDFSEYHSEAIIEEWMKQILKETETKILNPLRVKFLGSEGATQELPAPAVDAEAQNLIPLTA